MKPVTVRNGSGTALDDVTQVVAGRDVAMALRATGTVRTWGRGTDGALGDGGAAERLLPVEVTGVS